MARPQRIWFPGATFHVEASGLKNAPLFCDRKDYAHYLFLLSKHKLRENFDIHAYALLPKKVHLLIETVTEEISSLIQRLHTSYAMYYNRRHKQSGHVFNGRFVSQLILDETHFFETSRIIHLTPLEEKPKEDISSYRWCSARDYLSPQPEGDPPHPVLSLDRTLSPFPHPKHQAFQKFLNLIS
ncbi:transposase [Alteribacillus iranensis]|uniref:REP element-mobilizing transposase RayT n=1 Tax=Alteribacillus iranensis TaxID=930128 RepID=A0A1I2B0D0_9BACI|nr:transposase [Alteribacillus iranensis]SFE49516.1 REP element-mobilizing transposase RayT [Alteribacillus iranensis]